MGIGGRLDATNILKHPVVSGVTSLGMDHMELLGDTIEKIAAEKAGIFKHVSPAFSVQQPPGAMAVLLERAAAARTSLLVPPSLSSYSTPHGQPLNLGLKGDHQVLNASLAAQLAGSWEAAMVHKCEGMQQGGGEGGVGVPGLLVGSGEALAAARQRVQQLQRHELPSSYVAGLEQTVWPGRSQVGHRVT